MLRSIFCHLSSIKNNNTAQFMTPAASLTKTIGLTTILAAGMGLTACTNDDPRLVILDAQSEEDAQNNLLTYQIITPVAMPEVTVNLYHLNTGELIESKVLTLNNPDNKPLQELSNVDAAHAVNIEFDKDEFADAGLKDELLLIEMVAIDGNATYYDPALNRMTAFAADQRLYGINQFSATNKVISVTPFSTLAVSRLLARMTHYDVLKPDDIATISQLIADKQLTNSQVLDQYVRAIVEVNTSFATDVNALTRLDSYTDLRDDPEQSSNSITTAQQRWYQTIVQLNTLPLGETPYLNLDDWLHLDILDGDLDGQTLTGLGNQGKVDNPISQTVAYIANPQTAFFEPIDDDDIDTARSLAEQVYFNQKPVLTTFETLMRPKFSDLINQVNQELVDNLLSPLSKASKQAITRWVDNTDNQIGINYSSYYGYIANSNRLYFSGLGNRTLSFGLVDGVTTKQLINADDLNLVNKYPAQIDSLIGHYDSSTDSCQLSVSVNGELTLTQGNQSMRTHVDRDLGDTIYRYADGYLLNAVTSFEDDSSIQEIIQTYVVNNQVQSAHAAVIGINQDISTPLANPSIRCNF